jgi:aerobic-type carbon monoxide dehydrogenase small subunit (CoxS/CutS family)
VIRDSLGLTGTKFSCGIAQCGACTLHVDGQPVRSCSFPVSLAVGKTIKTIEGVSPDGNHPIQRAWKELDAPQCGYCQSGMIMSALALLQRNQSDRCRHRCRRDECLSLQHVPPRPQGHS